MRAPALVMSVLLAVASAPCAASAQPPPGKTARIGLLGDVPAFLDQAFRQGLRELGWVEGRSRR